TRFLVLRGLPGLRSVHDGIFPADPDFPGAARHLRGLSNRRRGRAPPPERHPPAARRRSSADRQPAADLERRGTVPGPGRLTGRSRPIVLLLLLCFVSTADRASTRAQGLPPGDTVRIGQLRNGTYEIV